MWVPIPPSPLAQPYSFGVGVGIQSVESLLLWREGGVAALFQHLWGGGVGVWP